MRLTYATRKSALALAQCRAFIAALKARRVSLGHVDIEFVELLVVTSGDRIQDRPLSEVGGKGLFVKEIEEALADGRADLAVHSIKDVPGLLPPHLAIACVPLREDPRDALVAPRHGALVDLPTGARVGTSSLRRSVALRLARPDLDIVPVRGNVDTRLRKVDEGQFDAIVLAHAGLLRLGLGARATEILSPEVSLPAIGQGALGIECREGDTATRQALEPLHDAVSAICVAAERGVLVALEGDCRTPIAAYAEKRGPAFHVRAFVSEPDGTHLRRGERAVNWPSSEEDARQMGFELGMTLKSGFG